MTIDRPARFAGVPALATILAAAACGPTIGVPPGERVADPEAAVAALQAAAPEGPVHARFAWELDEAGSRLRGQGVVRAVPGERARLDLFGPRGETYLSAALVGGEYRFAGGAEPQVQLPPPAFLWAAFGVFDPPARPVEAAAADGRLTLRYQEEGQETLEFTADGWEHDPRLVRARRGGPRGVAESIDVTWTADGAHPRTARYRDWREYRTLNLTLEEWNVVEGFDPAIFFMALAPREPLHSAVDPSRPSGVSPRWDSAAIPPRRSLPSGRVDSLGAHADLSDRTPGGGR